MSSENKNNTRSAIFEKLLTIISSFGDTLLNIENSIDDLNQRIARIEFKINEINKKTEGGEVSIEKELSRLETDLNAPTFTQRDLKELEEMEKELLDTDDDIDLKELERLENE